MEQEKLDGNGEKDAIALLEGLIGIYSPSANEAEAVAYLVEQMRKLGLKAEMDGAGNAVGFAGSGAGPLILLLGHIDTVSGTAGCGNDGESVGGRGAVDAKGPLAAMVMADSRFANDSCANVAAVAAVGEETSSKGAIFISKTLDPDYVIVGEPSGTDGVTIGYRGSLHAKISVRCAEAHASMKGNAVEKGIGIFQKLQTGLGCADGFGSVSLKPMRAQTFGSESANVDPELFEMTLDCRMPPGRNAEKIADELREIAEREGNGEAEIEMGCACNGFEVSENDPVVRALVQSVRESGRTPRYLRKLGSSDMNIVQGRLGTASYGPGDPRLSHTKFERVAISDYLDSIGVLERAIRRLLPKVSAGL